MELAVVSFIAEWRTFQYQRQARVNLPFSIPRRTTRALDTNSGRVAPARSGIGGKFFAHAFPRLLPGSARPSQQLQPWLAHRTFNAKDSNDRGGQRAQHEALP